MTGNNNTEDTIDLLRLLWAMLRVWWLFVLAAVIGGAGAYAVSKLCMTPVYRSSFTAYVNNNRGQTEGSLSSSDIYASRYLAETYSEIIASYEILNEVADTTGVDLTWKQLAGLVETEVVDETEIMRISVTMDNPETARAVAQAIADTAPSYISTVVEGSSMTVISPPELPTSVYSPRYARNAAMGCLLGAALVAAVVVLRELFDDRVKDEADLVERYGISVMGNIPDLTADDRYSYGYRKEGR